MDPDVLYQQVVETYSKHINPGMAKLMAFAGFGVEMRGEGCYIYDHEDRQFLDCLGGYGVFTHGHRHPKIVAAVKRQLDLMPLGGKAFFNPVQAKLAEKLSSIAPGKLEYTFFSNSGTEAVEAALKFAKAATGRPKIVSTQGSYHGKTMGALSTTGRDKYREPFLPLVPGVTFVPYGDAETAAAEIDHHTACFIVEVIQGEGGVIVPPRGYLPSIRNACDKVGALLIVDEVQTGMGRTGLMFGCNHEGIEPDLLTLAKALGGGVMPIGATMGTAAVWDAVFGKNPLVHTSTFGGGQLACAAGIAALEVIEEEGLCERARTMGARLKAGLEGVRETHSDLIAEVRGEGLILGVEFKMDEVGELCVAQMMKRGMCAAYTLNNPRVIRFEPPLIINEDQVDFASQTFGEAVAETAEVLSELV
ncbi:MAG TPA: aspartate aminotransferase family protein [Fimbriimonadaceae bacterium]|nr:aspartate aminotransferase family protein [Fimbriimonadaceae bacterium]